MALEQVLAHISKRSTKCAALVSSITKNICLNAKKQGKS